MPVFKPVMVDGEEDCGTDMGVGAESNTGIGVGMDTLQRLEARLQLEEVCVVCDGITLPSLLHFLFLSLLSATLPLLLFDSVASLLRVTARGE